MYALRRIWKGYSADVAAVKEYQENHGNRSRFDGGKTVSDHWPFLAILPTMAFCISMGIGLTEAVEASKAVVAPRVLIIEKMRQAVR